MYVYEMMIVKKEMGKGFNLQTIRVWKVFTILEVMFESMFVKVIWYKFLT